MCACLWLARRYRRRRRGHTGQTSVKGEETSSEDRRRPPAATTSHINSPLPQPPPPPPPACRTSMRSALAAGSLTPPTAGLPAPSSTRPSTATRSLWSLPMMSAMMCPRQRYARFGASSDGYRGEYGHRADCCRTKPLRPPWTSYRKMP